MEGIVVSLNENILKVSINDYEGQKGGSRKLESTIVSGSEILNVEAFADILREIINEISTKHTKKLPLNFLVQPQDVILSFVTIPKNTEDVTAKVISEVKDKLEGLAIENVYFSYAKIAPFVYQFVAIQRAKLEQYLAISTLVGYELKSVVPWLVLLPKFLKDNDSSIFVTRSEGKQVIALAELNGIYFVGVYEKDKTTKEIQKLVTELSVYKRSSPITRVFTVNYDDFNLEEGYQISPLSIPIEGLVEDDSYNLHTLFTYVVGNITGLLTTQNNLLNLLPLPAIAKKNSLVYVGAVITALLLVVGGFGGYKYFTGNSTVDKQSPGVLSETQKNTETTPSKEVPVEKPVKEEVKVEEPKEIIKEDLKIRVENGAGIAGIAASTQEKLEGFGYTVVDIGNAEGDSRENTLVKLKTSKLAYRESLVEDLKEDFEIILEDGLDEETEYDVLIVVGQN